MWGWIVTICSDRSDCHAVLHPTVRWSVVKDLAKKACMLIKGGGGGGNVRGIVTVQSGVDDPLLQ